MEFLSPSFHHPAAIFFEVMLVLGAAAACWNLLQGRFTEPLLLLMWAHAALLAARNIPVFVIVAALPVAGCARGVAGAPARHGTSPAGCASAAREVQPAGRRERPKPRLLGRWHLVSALGVLLVAAVIYAPNPPKKFPRGIRSGPLPGRCAGSALRQDPSARIFTDDEWGDYLIWSLYPSHRVFIDGRSDFYGEDFEERVHRTSWA